LTDLRPAIIVASISTKEYLVAVLWSISFDSSPKVFDVVEFAVGLGIEDTIITTLDSQFQVETFCLGNWISFQLFTAL
jgi:hypothetical protein